MAGIYIHIPFCKKACHYCDFHFSTSLKNKSAFIDALKKEIVLQKNYLSSSAIHTIYFGGGTPSLLDEEEIQDIFELLHKHYTISSDAEITLEANPDDLTRKKLLELKHTPINRFSIGVQSFFKEDLLWMNRAHNEQEAERSILLAQDTGFDNLTIDLIYGYPLLSKGKWESNLQKAFALNVPHISCYCLTEEEGTALSHFIKKKQTPELSDKQATEHFQVLLEQMKNNGFIQYEISNFCKPNYFSKHNTNYWLKKHYLGLGPSAHSYNGISRQWNISNNAVYIQSIEKGEVPFELEQLSLEKQYNEYVMTSLRTMWGTDLKHIALTYGSDFLNYLNAEIAVYVGRNKVFIKNDRLFLTDEGKLIADKIASDLFIV